MNTIIASILKSKLLDLEFVDKIAGLVHTAEKSQPTDVEGAFMVSKFPISADVNFDECFNSNCFSDLVPNSKHKGILYFEDLSTTPSASQNGYHKYTSKLRLVCWINNRLIQGDNCQSIAHLLITQIRFKLEIGPFNQNNVSKISVSAYNIESNDKKLFAKYTYPDDALKYLIHPYEAFGIDFKVDYSISIKCLPELVIEAYNCNPEAEPE